MERVYDLGGVEDDVAGGGGIALEAVHTDDGDLIMELRCDYSAMFANALVFLSGTTSKSQAGRMTWSRNTPGCPHVGHSLMDSTGSASITVTITVFCGVADGIDDGISVRLHSRSLVVRMD
ncbi:hypothetical protein Q6D62_09660 [Corynebacterium diphtheriae]|nr:hypothetical protein [Corynebacterium diphtheriae]UEB38368.1 hypothetical protein LK425_08055 [Corynebacterium diphtheriae]WLF42410.1 hypothetical protein Q6D62_09660 [Corynebacterium diphtheriae]CAB0570316.1 hypothetical protein CIP107523_02108 [Corynebacterium diphtheriae]CAB0572190.1 hypothetical protein CIP107529_02231 [Corynebacterium diphtheriae]CAB0619450.1 hypothetical protein CIP107554_02154 [Corynebacterium diphtheriae]